MSLYYFSPKHSHGLRVLPEKPAPKTEQVVPVAATATLDLTATDSTHHRVSAHPPQWGRAHRELLKRAQACQLLQKSLIADGVPSELTDPFYDEPERVILRYLEVSSGLLRFRNIQNSVDQFEQILSEDNSLTPEQILNMERDFERCSSSEVADLVTMTFEVLEKQDVDPEVRTMAFEATIFVARYRLENHPATGRQLSTTIHLMLGLLRAGYFSPEQSSLFARLNRKAITPLEFMQRFPKMVARDEVKRDLYRRQYADNKVLAAELLEFLSRFELSYE